jgi:hypothetical protein
MTHQFGVSHVTDYLSRMGLKIARTDENQELVELAFHGNHGQWRMIVGFQQEGDVRKLMLIVPHIGTVTNKKRLECLEALMAVNYRIAMGKFGLDLDDGEVRLEEAVPIADGGITFEQFQLVFGAIMQTIAVYHSLLPRIVYGNISVQEALVDCEQEFVQEMKAGSKEESQVEDAPPSVDHTELDVRDVMAEVTRIFEEKSE